MANYVTWSSIVLSDTTTDVEIPVPHRELHYMALAIKGDAAHTIKFKWSPDASGTVREDLAGATGKVAGDNLKVEWPYNRLYARATAGTGTSTIYYAQARYD